MGDHLLVRELVALSALDAVEDEHGAVGCGAEDEDGLVERGFDGQDTFHFEGQGLARPLGGDLAEPAVCCVSELQYL